jgi:hypothetical protein
MSSPRHELQDALAAAADLAGIVPVTVYAEEPIAAPALPALVIRPGAPYRSATPELPHCLERWRLEVLALVPIDAVLPLEVLDVLIELTRDVARDTPAMTYYGVRETPARIDIAGKPHRGAVIVLDVDV